MNDYTLPTEIHHDHPSHGEMGQNLRQLVDTPTLGIRPEQFTQPQKISFIGGSTFKVRAADFGETALSQSEIEHAINHGITI